MSNKVRVGIVGYGNLGRGVEYSIGQNSDMELVSIFTRRDPKTVTGAKPNMVHISEIESYKDKIDVMILCGGSAIDLPTQTPEIASMFNVVDSFDTHAKIPEHFVNVDRVAKEANNVGIISIGWDPGLFSVARLIGQMALPVGKDYTFWGRGVSQGHSDAIRRVEGVQDGVQYTIPVESAIESVRKGENKELTTREKHERLCYVVAKEGADKEKIAETIKNMPNYFSDYDTTVNFISQEELNADHKGMPHGGFVIRTGVTGENTKQKVEFNLELGSNPEFTGSILVAFARAAARLNKEGQSGAKTIFDIPLGYLSIKSDEELRKELL